MKFSQHNYVDFLGSILGIFVDESVKYTTEIEFTPEFPGKLRFLAIFLIISCFKEFESVSEAINWYRESLYDVFEVLKFWS